MVMSIRSPSMITDMSSAGMAMVTARRQSIRDPATGLSVRASTLSGSQKASRCIPISCFVLLFSGFSMRSRAVGVWSRSGMRDAPNASTAAADGLPSGMTAYVGRIPSSCSFDRFPGMFRGMVRVSVFSDWVLDIRGVIRDRTGGGYPLRSAWIAALPVWFFWLTARSSSSGVSRVMALPFSWVWSCPVASKSLGRLPRCRRVG